MTTPVLQALHQAYPEARIDIVADERSGTIFQYCPYRGDILYKHKGKFLRGAPALIKQLWRKRYDIIVDLRTDGLAYLLRGRRRLTKKGGRSYGQHAIESLMGIIRIVHGNQPLPATRIWLRQDSAVYARNILTGLPGRRVLAIAPGCGGKRQRKFWPVNNYAQLANALADVFDGVFLLGGSDDEKLCRNICKDLKLPYIDMCNRTTLLQAAALLQQADMFAGSDSGLGHVAGAVDTATLTFFSTDTPKRCLPWGPSASWLMGQGGDARNISVAEAEVKIREAISK